MHRCEHPATGRNHGPHRTCGRRDRRTHGPGRCGHRSGGDAEASNRDRYGNSPRDVITMTLDADQLTVDFGSDGRVDARFRRSRFDG
jgi:hypothetical protein